MIREKRNTIACIISLILSMFCNQGYGQESVMNRLSYRSDINHRYAVTWVTAHMENPSDNATEILFKMTLPKTAFISGLIMEVDGRNYTSRVEDKKVAQKIYDEAKKQDASAGLVEHSGFAEQKFEVSTNVEASGKVIFYLKYEELLVRSKGIYMQNIQINPGVIPSELGVTVNIRESAEITGLKVLDSPLGGPNGTQIQHVNTNHYVVSYHSQGPNGLYGELTLTYDVKREKDAGEIMVLDDYFVHFFSPGGLEKMPAHTVFILDISGSMSGQKLEQLKESLLKILGDLEPEDSFELLTFSDVVESLGVYTKSNIDDMKLTEEKILNLEHAGWTNINDALIHGFKNALKGCQNTANQVVFLTDGEANRGETNQSVILKNILEINTMKIPLYSLAYGDDADFRFLSKISFNNRGFGRKIPLHSNTAEVLRGFYQEIGTPLIADINIKYSEDAVNQTTIVKNGLSTLQEGNEIIVAGQLMQGENELHPEIDGIMNTGPHKYKVPRLSKPIQPDGKENFIGRLWAYLTIQNHMNTAELTDVSSEREELYSRARSLALKYNFVTKLTSLVVVRPGDLLEEEEDIPLFLEEQQNKEDSHGSPITQSPIRSPPASNTTPWAMSTHRPAMSTTPYRPPAIHTTAWGMITHPPTMSTTPNPFAWPASIPASSSGNRVSAGPVGSGGHGGIGGYPSSNSQGSHSTWWTVTPPSSIRPSFGAVCDPLCKNGQCVSLNNCSCSYGWSGQICDIPVCDLLCKNGECNSSDTCSCSFGWTGEYCDEPVCDPLCKNGRCISPNKCSCSYGWTGELCDIPVCSPACINGECSSPNRCSCSSGWTGQSCEEAICDSVCMNGRCTSPNTCSCASGWTGEYCDIRICNSECVMGEYISQNNCNCSAGWIGQHCDKRCPYDFITSSDKCYKVLTEEKLNWHDAKLKCSSLGLKAASKPSDPAGLRKYIIDNYAVGTRVWLDARGAGSHYLWEQDNSTLSFNDPLWKSGEPKSYERESDSCLYITSRHIDWKLEPDSPYAGARCEDSNLASALCEV